MELNKDDKRALQLLLFPLIGILALPLFGGLASLVAASLGLAAGPAIALVGLAVAIAGYCMNMAVLGLGPWSWVTISGGGYTFTFQMWMWAIIAVLITAGGAA